MYRCCGARHKHTRTQSNRGQATEKRARVRRARLQAAEKTGGRKQAAEMEVGFLGLGIIGKAMAANLAKVFASEPLRPRRRPPVRLNPNLSPPVPIKPCNMQMTLGAQLGGSEYLITLSSPKVVAMRMHCLVPLILCSHCPLNFSHVYVLL